jgi:hypothetical protein
MGWGHAGAGEDGPPCRPVPRTRGKAGGHDPRDPVGRPGARPQARGASTRRSEAGRHPRLRPAVRPDCREDPGGPGRLARRREGESDRQPLPGRPPSLRPLGMGPRPPARQPDARRGRLQRRGGRSPPPAQPHRCRAGPPHRDGRGRTRAIQHARPPPRDGLPRGRRHRVPCRRVADPDPRVVPAGRGRAQRLPSRRRDEEPPPGRSANPPGPGPHPVPVALRQARRCRRLPPPSRDGQGDPLGPGGRRHPLRHR